MLLLQTSTWPHAIEKLLAGSLKIRYTADSIGESKDGEPSD